AFAQKGGLGVPLRGGEKERINRAAGTDLFTGEEDVLWVSESAPVYDNECPASNPFDLRVGNLTDRAAPLIGGDAAGEGGQGYAKRRGAKNSCGIGNSTSDPLRQDRKGGVRPYKYRIGIFKGTPYQAHANALRGESLFSYPRKC